MVRVSYDQKPYRRALMETFGARCVAEPVRERPRAGRAILEERADHPAASASRSPRRSRVAAQRDDTKYALGSVLNHVLLHQTVIGQEAIAQMEMAGDYPDMMVGCTGGGSNFAGHRVPVHRREAARRARRAGDRGRAGRLPEPDAGEYAYDFGDTGQLTPLVKMHTLGSTFVPPGFHAGGLRYHGMAPLVSHLKELGLIEARAYHQTAVLRGGRAASPARRGSCRRRRRTTPSRAAIDEALRCKEEGARRDDPVQPVRARALRHAGVHRLLRGQARGREYDESELAMALAGLPAVSV